MLADYGADVVWVERPGGDPCRDLEPAGASVFNRGKRSVEADLTDAPTRERILELADRADVFLESWAPGVADALGLGYETLHARNPRLVYVSIAGYAEDGRDVGITGYEAIVQAAIGSMSDQAGVREGPVFIGFPYASLGAAFLAVIGALAALYRRDDDGHGRHVSTSLADGALVYNAMFWGESDESVAFLAGLADAPTAPQIAQTSSMRLLTRSFECADGEYVGIHTGALGAFGRAMAVLGLDDRIPPSETGMDIGVPLTPEQAKLLWEETPNIFMTKPRDEWVKLFLEADVCAVEHMRPTEVFDTPQAVHNEMVVEVDDPVLGRVQQVGIGAKLSACRSDVTTGAPRVGEHTETVLADLAGWTEPASATTMPVADTRPLLDGVKILDLGAFYAGPYSSRLLADLGADVVKLEPLLGDQLRGIERPFYSAQAKKRALAANLKDPSLDRARAGLLAWADIVHHNLRPGAADRLGLDYASVKGVNPKIVYLHAPGWGSTGPFAMRQSFAPMLSGYVGVTYEVAGQFNPPLPPSANEDPGNGLLGAVGILLALLHRNRTGEGQFVENPQLNATMSHMGHVVRTADGEVIGAGRLDPLQMGFGPFERLYETADGLVCLVAYDETDRQAACDALGVERVASDDGQADRIMAAVLTRSVDETVAALRAAGVAAVHPAGPNIHAFMNDPEQRRIGRVAEVAHGTKGNVRELHVLLRVSDAEQVPHRLAPELGEHTDELLMQIGYSTEEIAGLRAAGAVR
jgi:crotonobetainyl-CoA:carnitine CoA-transferase CaiB-like acyl-CoA transferase